MGEHFREARFLHGVLQATRRSDVRTLQWWITRYNQQPVNQSVFVFVFDRAVVSDSLDLLTWLADQGSSLPTPTQRSVPLDCTHPDAACWLHDRGYRIAINPGNEVEKGNLAFLQWTKANAAEIPRIDECLKIALNGNHLEMANWLVETFPNVRWQGWNQWGKYNGKDVGMLKLDTIKWVEACSI